MLMGDWTLTRNFTDETALVNYMENMLTRRNDQAKKELQFQIHSESEHLLSPIFS